MQKSRLWIMGLAVVAVLMLSVGIMASAPKMLEVNPQHFADVAAARSAHIQTHMPRPAKTTDESAKKPEAYTLYNYGWSEGWADQIATNGKVVVWANDGTYFGNVLFAPANDMAHPTAWAWGTGAQSYYGIQNPIQFVGDHCFINYVYDIYEFDCSDPTNIQFVADYDMNCYTYYNDGITDFRVKNGYIYAALGRRGFIIYAVGNPTWPAFFGNPTFHNQVVDNPGLALLGGAGVWPTLIEVTDDTMILIDNTSGYGACYVWDITNMVDPLHTVVPFEQGVLNTNPFFDPATFGNITQFRYISGWGFVANPDINYDPTTNLNYGVMRFDWADESNVDTYQNNFQIANVNDGFNGRARHIRNFDIIGTGSMVFTAYEDVRDPGAPFTDPDIDGDSASKWDWSNWATPNELLVYKMDRFFYNNEDNFETPVSYNVFYGGAHIAFAASGLGSYRTFIAGFNYLAAFDDFGMMVDHYVCGADPQDWPWLSVTQFWNGFAFGSQPLYKMPPAATVWNIIRTSDDKYAIEWYPEGVEILDLQSGDQPFRTGFWECPSRADFVRNVAITSDDHYALVACGSLGLIVLDLSNPSAPVKVGNWWTYLTAPGSNKQPVSYVFINGRYAYVQTRVITVDALNPTANVNVVRVLDISNPPLPAEVASYASPITGLLWDVNHMQLANAYTYLGHIYLQISNGQGADEGSVYSPAFGNSGYNATSQGSLIIADVTTPSALANRFNVPLTTGSYAFMSAFYTPQDASNYWAYVADGWISLVDMGDPAMGIAQTRERGVFNPYSYAIADKLLLTYPTSGGNWTEWPNYCDKVWRVNGANQIITAYDKANFWFWYFYYYYGSWGTSGLILRAPAPGSSSTPIYPAMDHWDATLPLMLGYIWPWGSGHNYFFRHGYWFNQLSDNTWLSTGLEGGDTLLWTNFTTDYIAPAFTTSGPMNNGWWTPYCGTSTYCGPLTGPIELKVQVIDNVAVTRVTFYAYYYSGQDWSWEYCAGYGVHGYQNLGNATGPDANNFWTKTISPANFHWTGWVQFYATARDAAYNYTTQYNTGGYWYVNAIPTIDVTVGPAGTDYAYVWSTTTVAAKVSPIYGDTQVARVLFKVDGLSIGNGIYNPSTNVWYVNWNTTLVGDGNHTVTAEVTLTNSSYATSDPVTKYVANNGPDSLLLSPVAGSMVYGTTSVSAQLKDASYPVPINHVDFYLDRPAGATSGGTLIGTATTATGGVYKISWDATTAVDGNHTIVAVFYDKRWDGTMRSKSSTWVSFSKVTPQPITATITANPTNPTDAQTVAFTSVVTGGITPYTYNWTSSPAGLTGTGPGAAYKFAAGSYTITLTVTDALGTTKTATLPLTVTNSVRITGVTKMSNPFRLEINGGTFLPGCTVKIGNGVVPVVKYVNASQLIAKKCSSLCPKGQAVQIIVVNPDGTQSAPYSYTR